MFLLFVLLTLCMVHGYYSFSGRRVGWIDYSIFLSFVILPIVAAFLANAIATFTIAILCYCQVIRWQDWRYNTNMHRSYKQYGVMSFILANLVPRLFHKATPIDQKISKQLQKTVGQSVLILAFLALVRPLAASSFLLEGVWNIVCFCYFAVFSASLLHLITSRYSGLAFPPLFVNPLAFSSLQDLWSKRWNLFFHEVALTRVYSPIRKLTGSRKSGFFATFIFSAAAHEWVMALCHSPYLGFMGCFFSLQGLGAWGISQIPLPGMTKRAFSWIWLLVTAPLFFKPAASVLPFLL